MRCHVLVGGEPHLALGLHVLYQFLENEHARAVADDMGMHGELEQPAFFPGPVELAVGAVSGRSDWKRFMLK